MGVLRRERPISSHIKWRIFGLGHFIGVPLANRITPRPGVLHDVLLPSLHTPMVRNKMYFCGTLYLFLSFSNFDLKSAAGKYSYVAYLPASLFHAKPPPVLRGECVALCFLFYFLSAAPTPPLFFHAETIAFGAKFTSAWNMYRDMLDCITCIIHKTKNDANLVWI